MMQCNSKSPARLQPATGVWKSANGGVSWAHVLANVTANSNGFTRHASPVLTIDAGRPWRVWVGAQQGVFRSEDGGLSWAPISAFNDQPWFHAGPWNEFALISLVPPDPANGRVDPALASHVVVGLQTAGLAFSPDDGATWQQLTFGHGAPVYISSPWRFHRMPNGTAFVGLDCAGGVGSTSGRVFRIDAPPGGWANASLWNWTDITPDLPPASDDQGFWGLVDTPEGYDGVLVVASSAYESLYTSRDGGATWVRRRMLVNHSLPCWQPNPAVWMQMVTWGRNNVVVSSRNPGVWLLSTGFGVAASTDEGDSWGWSSKGIGQVVSMGCHSHPTRANWTFCGVADLTGFIIDDAGASGCGLSVFHELPVYWGVDFGRTPAWLHPGGNASAGGSSSSSSGGLAFPGGTQQWPNSGLWITWADPGAPPSPTSLTWVAGANTSGALHGVPGLEFVGSLQSPDDPLDLLMLVAPGDGSGRFSPWNASEPAANFTGGCVRSTDGGVTWVHTAQPPAGDVGTIWGDRSQLSLDGGDADARWWALWSVGIFVSRDRGQTWGDPLPYFSSTELEAVVKPDGRGGAGCVYALGAGGQVWSRFKPGSALLHTCDYGATWAAVGNFTAGWGQPPLATHASGRIALVAFADGDELSHVWVSVDAGATWTAVDDPARGEYLAPNVGELEWDAVDPTVLYVSTDGHSVVVVKLGG